MTVLNPGPALNADYRNLSSASFCGGSTAGFLCLDLPYHNEVSFVMPQPKKKNGVERDIVLPVSVSPHICT